MTTIQLNAEIYLTMGIIAEDENLLKQALRYLKKLASKKLMAITATNDVTDKQNFSN